MAVLTSKQPIFFSILCVTLQNEGVQTLMEWASLVQPSIVLMFAILRKGNQIPTLLPFTTTWQTTDLASKSASGTWQRTIVVHTSYRELSHTLLHRSDRLEGAAALALCQVVLEWSSLCYSFWSKLAEPKSHIWSIWQNIGGPPLVTFPHYTCLAV